VAGRKRRNTVGSVVLTVLILAVGAVLTYAWVDGGQQPLRDITEPLPVPGGNK